MTVPSVRELALQLRNTSMVAMLVGLGAIATPLPARAEASPQQPVALEAEALEVEVPEELEDLREMGEQVGDLLSEIDPKVLQQVMRPLGRQALRIFLDSAPGLSQKAIDLGEEGLEKLEERAMEGLEQAQERFELEAEGQL